MLLYAAVCCGMLQYAAVCCSMLQYAAHFFIPQKYRIKHYLHPKIKFHQNQIYVLGFLKYAAKMIGVLQTAAAATSTFKSSVF